MCFNGLLLIMRPSYRPHYASCTSVCPSLRLSVCPVLARNSKIKKHRKIKIGTDVPHGTSKWNTSFQFKRSKVKVTVRKNLQNLASSLFTGDSAGGSRAAGADCTLGLYAIVRTTLLSAPETLGNGTDGRIQCRCGHILFLLRSRLKRWELCFMITKCALCITSSLHWAELFTVHPWSFRYDGFQYVNKTRGRVKTAKRR